MGVRVLVVDDDASFSKTVVRALAKLAEVVVEASGACALARFERGERFDVVLCDVMMPGMTGPEMYDRMAVCAPELCRVLVFATGGMDPGVAAHLATTGRPCLLKPLDIAALRGLVVR